MRTEMTQQQKEEIIDFMQKFRRQVCERYGHELGTKVFGCYAPSILSEYLQETPEDKICKILLQWAEE